MNYPTIWPQFFTATIQNWKVLLKEDGQSLAYTTIIFVKVAFILLLYIIHSR